MKKLLIAAAALAALALPALADTTVVLGCEVTDKGGYLNKVDPTCQFSHNPGGNYPSDSGLTWDDLVDALNEVGG